MDKSTDFGPIVAKERKIQAEVWDPRHAAPVRAAGSGSDALFRFYQKQTELDAEIWKHERQYKEKDEAIDYKAAVALAVRIKDLRLSEGSAGCADYIAFLAGKCLTLKEGRATGKVYTAFASLEVVNIPECRGRLWHVHLAIPAELRDAPFGVQTPDWLSRRCKDVARELARPDSPPDSPASRMFDAMFDRGRFAFCNFWKLSEQPEPDSIPVVLAPHEDTIKDYIQRRRWEAQGDCRDCGARGPHRLPDGRLTKRCARCRRGGRSASGADYWDALTKAAAMLLRSQQPLGEALGDWKAREIDGQTKRPDGRKVTQGRREALRNSATIEALKVLQRCGLPVSRNHRYREISDLPPAGCDAVAEAFNLGRDIILKIWKQRGSAVS